MTRQKKTHDPFRWFDSSPEVIRLVVMMYVRYPLSLRNVEDLLFERGIDICHETVRLWWNRFGPMFAGEIRRKRVQNMRAHTHWRWHLDEGHCQGNGDYLFGTPIEGRSPPDFARHFGARPPSKYTKKPLYLVALTVPT